MSDEEHDIFMDILPEKMEYVVVDSEGQPVMDGDEYKTESFKEILHAGMVTKYGDRCINHERKYWVQKYRTWFDPVLTSTLAKKFAIWMQDKELDVNYANLTETIENVQVKPVRNASSELEIPSTRDTTTRRFLQPSGPLGAANIIRESMESIENPLTVELYAMERMFVNETIIEDLMGWQS